eukprot:c8418_g1_i1.p1 GENE.c8418_g1_i1~~c8418_g1_i1.p1  ORF type:complete len:682 (-),score=119.45 c8418_g1_i1:582-2627(-)
MGALHVMQSWSLSLFASLIGLTIASVSRKTLPDGSTELEVLTTQVSTENLLDFTITLDPTVVALPGANSIVGVLFDDLSIPRNAVISSAWLEFNLATASSMTPFRVNVAAMMSISPPPLTLRNRDLSSRQLTYSSSTWNFLRQSGVTQTVNVAAILEEMVCQKDWGSSSGILFLLEIETNSRGLQGVLVVARGSTRPKLYVSFRQAAISLDITNPTWSEETTDGDAVINGEDLELPMDQVFGEQVVGLRFSNVSIPRGATIYHSYIQFQCDEASRSTVTIRVNIENSVNAQALQAAPFDVSVRPTASSFVDWNIPDWNVVGERTMAQQTPDIAALLREIISKSSWEAGNPVLFTFRRAPTDSETTTTRWAESGLEEGSPSLHIVYCVSDCPVVMTSVSPEPSFSPTISPSPSKIIIKHTPSRPPLSQTGAIAISVAVSAAAFGVLIFCSYRSRSKRATAKVAAASVIRVAPQNIVLETTSGAEPSSNQFNNTQNDSEQSGSRKVMFSASPHVEIPRSKSITFVVSSDDTAKPALKESLNERISNVTASPNRRGLVNVVFDKASSMMRKQEHSISDNLSCASADSFPSISPAIADAEDVDEDEPNDTVKRDELPNHTPQPDEVVAEIEEQRQEASASDSDNDDVVRVPSSRYEEFQDDGDFTDINLVDQQADSTDNHSETLF